MTTFEAEILRVEFLDLNSLPEPWCQIVSHWVHHHPDRIFLPELDCSGRYLLSWDDMRDILVTAGVIGEPLIT